MIPLLLDQNKDYFAGFLAGITKVLTGQPFDTIKIRLQANK
jgi:hypothetical protein